MLFLRSNFFKRSTAANLVKSNFPPKNSHPIAHYLMCASFYFSVRLFANLLFLFEDNSIKRNLQDHKSSLQLYFPSGQNLIYVAVNIPIKIHFNFFTYYTVRYALRRLMHELHTIHLS